jgi:hypothetical protein
MKKTIIKILLLFVLGFILMFGFRMLYGYWRYDSQGNDTFFPAGTQYSYSDEDNSSDYAPRRNIASDKWEKKGSKSESNVAADMRLVPQSAETSQKYEKVGKLTAKSREFETSEKKVRGLVREYNGLIQYEQKKGMPGDRSLYLVIGVPPISFDSMITDLKGIGRLKSIVIDKIDKTNEYRELTAKRISLEKTVNSLITLKEKGGKIDEYVNLEERILDYQQQLQDLGVELGDYDQENEFCTIKYSLSEDNSTAYTVPVSHRIMVSLEWTIKYYGVFTIFMFLAALGIFISLKIVQIIRILPKPQFLSSHKHKKDESKK